MSPKKLRAAALAAVCLCVLPAGLCFAFAGQSGDGKQQSAETKPVPLSADTVAEIQRAIDEERYLDAGNMLDQALVASGGDARLLLLAGPLSLARGRYADALTSFKSIEFGCEGRRGRQGRRGHRAFAARPVERGDRRAAGCSGPGPSRMACVERAGLGI